MRPDVRPWLKTWPLVLLFVLVSSRWLLESGLPSAASTSVTQAAGCLLAAGGFGVLTILKRRRERVFKESKSAGRYTAFAVSLTGPAIAARIFQKQIGSNNGTLALAITPIVIATLLSIRDESGEADLIGGLWPGLAGLTGLLLLLPEPASKEWRFWLALAVMPLLTGSGAALCTQEQASDEEQASNSALAYASVIAAVIFGLLALTGRQSPGPPSVIACGLDSVTAFLSLLALDRLGGVRWASQFLLIPLLGLGEGILLLHPFLDLRSWFGLGLLAFSGLRLFLSGSANYPHATRLDLHRSPPTG